MWEKALEAKVGIEMILVQTACIQGCILRGGGRGGRLAISETQNKFREEESRPDNGHCMLSVQSVAELRSG